MSYTRVPYLGQIGTAIRRKGSATAAEVANIITDIAVLSISVRDDFSYMPVDYKPVNGTWSRILLNPKYASPYDYSGGTISLTFISKLNTKQPIFYVDTTASDRALWIKIVPTFVAPQPSGTLGSIEYRGVKCIQASLEQQTIGDRKLMMGSAVYQYLYKKFA